MTRDDLLDDFIRTRDERAFRALYRRHTPMQYALALRLTRSSEDAEEIVQEAWVRAVQRLDGFEGRSSFRTWLTGILVNCYRELLRERTRRPVPLEERVEQGTGPVEPFERRRSADPVDLERALAKLSDGYREVVVLHDVNGHTHREIAALLRIDEGTSKSQLARGRRRLRELLGESSGPRARRGGSL